MTRLFKSKRAQSTMEYALLIAVVIGVFSAMQIYMRRSLQARVKGGLDNVPGVAMSGSGQSAATIFGTATQYEPYYIREGSSTSSSTTGEGLEKGVIDQEGGAKEISGATSTRTGSQTITGAKED